MKQYLGLLGDIPTKLLNAYWRVTGHFIPRSFRTQVISYHFGHFVPTFIFNLVISYPVWLFRTHFVPSLVISYLLLLFSRELFWSFRTCFFTVLYPNHFVPEVISYPGHFIPTSKLGTNWLWYEMTFFIFAVICYFQTRYQLTLVWNNYFFP